MEFNFAGKKKKKKKVRMPTNGKYICFFCSGLCCPLLEHLVDKGNKNVLPVIISINFYLFCRFAVEKPT